MFRRGADEDTPVCEALSDGEEDVEETQGGLCKASFHIPMVYFSYIIGAKGSTKKRLETETRSKIIIPKLGQSGNIVVTAQTKKNVASARRRIRMMVLSSKRRRKITHFISIPMNKPAFQNGFMNFKTEVLEKFGNDNGIIEEVFQSPERLHLTISVMVLSDDVERNEAAAALQECKEIIISPLMQSDKLEIEMCGVTIFSDKDDAPSRARVLYGKVKIANNDTLLQELADGINTFFTEKGLLVQEKKSVALHCTLMNTSFCDKSKEEGEENVSGDAPKVQALDVTNILEHYKDFDFGTDICETIEISIMGSTTRDEFYKATSSVTVP